MEASDRFELEFGRRLRAELDSLQVRRPLRLRAMAGGRAPFGFGLDLLRPLALAIAALLAFAAVATAATRSPDPGQWVKPTQWTTWLVPSSPSPAAEPAVKPSPPASADSGESPAEPRATESEPGERLAPGATGASAEPSDSGTASPEGGGDG